MIGTTFRRGAGSLVVGLLVAGGGVTAAQATETANTNDAAYWEAYLEGEGYVDVSCTKVEAGGLSALGEIGQVDLDEDGVLDAQAVFVYDAWLFAVVKAGSTEGSVDEENTLFWDVAAGDPLYHASGKDISHVIGCTVEMPEEPTEPEPSEPEPATPTQPGTPGGPGDDAGKPVGPVVQTDVPEKGVNPALPLAAAVVAGLGLAGLGLRRRGQEN